MKRVIHIFFITAALLIIIPAFAKQVRASTIIKNVDMVYDLDVIDLNTDVTEKTIADRIRNNSSVGTPGVSVFQGNASLFYKYSETEWYGTGTGSNMISSSRVYAFSFVLDLDDGYDWPASVKAFNTSEHPNVQTPISKAKGFTVSRGGQVIPDAWIQYHTNGNDLTIILPACPDIKNAEITGIKDYVYDGDFYTFMPSVRMHGELLSNGYDYRLKYEPEKEPGTYTAGFTGSGHYTGLKYIRYRILFKDVPSEHNFADAVYWTADAGIASGYSGKKKGLFGINDPITRGQVLLMLWRSKGSPEPYSNTQTFKDVPTSHNFYKAIQWAFESGIAGGYTGSKNGYFGPSDPCTRGQIITFIWRYENKPEPQNNIQNFSDVPASNNFFKAVNWAYEQKITGGYSNGTFGVNKNCTRGHCVTFLYRVIPKG